MIITKLYLARPRTWLAIITFSLGIIQPLQSIAQKKQLQKQQYQQQSALTPIVKDQVIVQRVRENNQLTAPDTTKTVRFVPNETYIMRTENKEIVNVDLNTYKRLNPELKGLFEQKEITLLPETFIQTGEAVGNELTYRIGIVSKQPLKYDFKNLKFLGSIKIFLLSESSSQNEHLNIPVPIEIVSNDLNSIIPVSKDIDHLSIPLTEIAFEDPDLSDSAQIKIITKSNPVGYETYIKVEPSIELSSSRRSFQGLGVQKIPISIRVIGTSLRDSVKVSFNAEKGTIIPNTIYVHFQSPSIVELRSEGLGMTKLTASSAFNSNELEFRYVFPWVFILMAIVGGVIGGIAKYFSNQDKLTFLKSIITGIVLGFFGSVVYYVLGYSLIQFEVSDIFNEFAVLGFSALIAFFGVKVPT